jgi:uncharacterized membrane protein
MALPGFPPLHPVLVHVPIVLIPLSALFAMLLIGWKKEWVGKALTLLLTIAALGAVASTTRGTVLMNQQADDSTKEPADELPTHQKLGIATGLSTLIVAGLWLWRRRSSKRARPQ